MKIKHDGVSSQRLAFSTHHLHAQYLRMPFGIRNAPAVFQRLMMASLRDLNWKTVIVYLDDILVFSTAEKHEQCLREVFQRFRAANLRLNGQKCDLFLDSIDYLGFHITPFGTAIQAKKLTAVQDFPRPDSQHKLREFCGLTNFFRKWIPRYSIICSA